ncbi:helix-turn-helix transcriptional regulator [Mucilaginibacter sp. 21P]|uniref:helix-turn-helix domain-containing protein n=1 Tax=Mucilaginibacter sp. 21P TaxID=2778902 RepID=UPI001C56BDE4|nr:AraC family transcriptional regulator [Mucilaginibacter sp. 21P]QXV64683.1 helix-turn-helix transcriptional regulator [Mucilaginibacter sp. 21P]
MSQIEKPMISYSCYFTRSREGEQFVPEHTFSYQISGTLTITDATATSVFNEGDFRFVKRNSLVKYIKQPPTTGGEFKSVSIYLTQEALRSFCIANGYASTHQLGTPSIITLQSNNLYKSFMDSLSPYRDAGTEVLPQLQKLKVNEAILILLQTKPELADILFDFNEPGKIDLESFMEKNFHFNVQMKRFAYLTGRSLATFKRDFEKKFNTTPGKWLLNRRLKEAYFQIKEKGRPVSEVYLDVGFEDLSHFSFAFKNKFGKPPSKIA